MKRLTTLFFFFCLQICFILISCHDTQTVIKGCCDDPPASAQVGTGWVWVPNVFTPNGDGWHDWMAVYTDSMKQIINIEIRNEDKVVVFTKKNIPLHDFGNWIWDGKINGRVEQALYSFTLQVQAIDHTIKTIEGHICNCPCDQAGDEDFKPISNCEFGLCNPNWTDCMEDESLPCFEH